MNQDKIIDIFKKVQMYSSCHQRCLKRAEQLYNEMDQNQFLALIFGYLRGVVFHLQNEYSARIIDFVAKFVVLITSKRESENPDDPDTSLLRGVIDMTLETHSDIKENVRYNSCLLLRLILHNIGEESSFDDDLYDKIQDALLTRAYDRTHSIQLQALLALERLQNPMSPNCPIIKTYSLLVTTDKNSAIRTEIVRMIAPLPSAISLIINKTRDVSSNVQKAAFKRCTDLSPKRFTIEERQFILKSGLSCDMNVKKIFNNLLNTWFNFYERDFIKFLNALKLDALEEDFIKWENLCNDVFKYLVKNIPVEDIISALPLSEKLIPLDEMTDKVETILFWLLSIKFLKVSNLLDDWDVVLPDLAPFCDYIESITQLKGQYIREGKWETLEYSQILFQLLEIAELCDISEEVGRQKLCSLVLSQIKEEAGSIKILRKLIALLSKLMSQKEDLINAVKGVISELHEVYVGSDVAPTPSTIDTVDAKIIQTQIWTAQIQIDEALKTGEYLKAEEFKKKRNEAQERLNQFNVVENVIPEAERNIIACNFLNVFIALMESPLIDTLTGTLQSIFDLVIMPLSDNYNEEVRWRFLKSVGSICIVDEAMAKKNAEILMSPLSTYYNGNPKKHALIVAIEMVSDLFLCYNTQVFSVETNECIARNISKRKLYSNNDGDVEVTGITKFYFEGVIHVIMELIDDEDAAISKSALISIHKMIMDKLSISPQFFSRLLLKWYHPTTDSSIRQLLSFIITSYLNHVRNGKEVMINSLLSVLRQITSAGMESPLAEIEVEDLLKFVAVFTISNDPTNHQNYHLSISEMVLAEIKKQSGSGLYVQHLTKLLVFLKLPKEDASIIRQLLNQVDSLLDDVSLGKSEKTNLNKFKKTIMEDIVLNDEAEDSDTEKDYLGTNETPNSGNQIGRKSEHQVLMSNDNRTENGSNDICHSGQNTSAEYIGENQNDKETRPSLHNLPSSENTNTPESMNTNHSRHLNQNSLPAGGKEKINGDHQLAQETAIDGIQNQLNQHLLVVINKQGIQSSQNSTEDSNSTGDKPKVIVCKMAKCSRNHNKTYQIQRGSSSEIINESDSNYQNKRQTRNSLINSNTPGSSKKTGQTTRTPSSNIVNGGMSDIQNKVTTQSTQSTPSPGQDRQRQCGRAIQISFNKSVSREEQADQNKTATRHSTQGDNSSQSNKHRKICERQTLPSSNKIVSESGLDYQNQMLTRQSSQNVLSNKIDKNHERKNGPTSQKSSEVFSGLELASQSKMVTRQSSQSSTSSQDSSKSQSKNNEKHKSKRIRTSLITNVSLPDLDSQNKKTISQSTQSSMESSRSTRSQTENREKNNGQTTQSSLSTNVSDLQSPNKSTISQSTESSMEGSRSARSQRGNHERNTQSTLSTNVSVLDLGSQNKKTISQSTQSSVESNRSTRSQTRNHRKNNGQTTQSSLSTNVSDLQSHNKGAISQSTQSSTESSRSTRSQTENREKSNGQTSQSSLSTNVSDLQSHNKSTISQSTESSMERSRSTRSQTGNYEKETQSSLSSNVGVLDLGSQNKKTISQSTQSSVESNRSTRSQTRNHGKNNGRTTQSSLSTNVSDLQSYNKRIISQSTQSSTEGSRSTRSQRGNHERNKQSKLSSNVSVLDLGSQNKKTISQSTQSSVESNRSTRIQTRNHGKNNGQTTQSSLSTNVSDLQSHNKGTISQSTQSSTESSRSTRSQPGNLESYTIQTTQPSLSTNVNVLASRNKKKAYHLHQNSSESSSSSRSQTGSHKRSLSSQIALSNESESEILNKKKIRQTIYNVSNSNSTESESPRESILDSSIENRPTNEKAESKQSSFSSVRRTKENKNRNAKRVCPSSQISSCHSGVGNKNRNLNTKKLSELNTTLSSSGTSGESRKSSRIRLRNEAKLERQDKRESNEALRETNSGFSSSPSPKKRKVTTHSPLKRRLR